LDRNLISKISISEQIYELGWNWDDFQKLAQGTLAGHLLECGCQITGGYYVHPGILFKIGFGMIKIQWHENRGTLLINYSIHNTSSLSI
jgi:hypothetical protein